MATLRKQPYLLLTTFSVALVMSLSTVMAQAQIRVNAFSPIGPVNRKIFGQNMEAADPRGIFSNNFDAKVLDADGIYTGKGFWDPVAQKPYDEIVQEVVALGSGMMRYPGGCLASNYDWRKAVGPLETRGQWRFVFLDLHATWMTNTGSYVDTDKTLWNKHWRADAP